MDHSRPDQNAEKGTPLGLRRLATVVAAGFFSTTLAQPEVIELPLQGLLKEVLHLSVTQMSLFFSIGALAWYCKPFVGIIADSYPLLGTHRLSYIVLGAVIVSRIVWVFPSIYLPRWLVPRIRTQDPAPGWQATFVLSWAGLRGVISLAAAAALSTDVPQRNLLVFLTFTTVLGTLLVQGLTLPRRRPHLRRACDGWRNWPPRTPPERLVRWWSDCGGWRDTGRRGPGSGCRATSPMRTAGQRRRPPSGGCAGR